MHLRKLYIKRILLTGCLMTICYFGFLYWSCSDIDSGIYVDCICKGPENRQCVALTFDDGPDEEMTPKILDILSEYNIKATFFVTGKNAGSNPELLARIINEGHIIGNHSWSHACTFPLQSAEDIYKELVQCDSLVYSVTGKKMSLFRPPFGVTNPLIAEAVSKNENVCIGWSIRSLDTDDRKSRKDVLSRIVRKLHNGSIILLHDRCEGSDELLQSLIIEIIDRNYEITNLDEMLGIEPYKVNI